MLACGKATAAKRCSQNWNEWCWRSCLGKIWCPMGMPGEHFPLACLESSAPSDPLGPNEREGSDAVVASYASITSKADLLAADAVRDIALCGRSLGKADPVHPDLASAGAHEPTPTPYFVLEELLGKLGLTANDHLLDVGCGTGRVLAYAASQLPCRATGVELDARLANIASSWAASSPQLNVIAGSVLDISLAPYTCFYLSNPFDTAVLTRFLDKAEREAARPFTLVHMSDNGESFAYQGRPGWRLVRSGSNQAFQTASGRSIKFYEFPQHYSVWRYEGVR